MRVVGDLQPRHRLDRRCAQHQQIAHAGDERVDEERLADAEELEHPGDHGTSAAGTGAGFTVLNRRL